MPVIYHINNKKTHQALVLKNIIITVLESIDKFINYEVL